MRRGSLHGAGLGSRRDFLDEAGKLPDSAVDFWEIAPENWIAVGGPRARKPLVCHGLSLSLGGPEPLHEAFIDQLRHFVAEYDVRYYTEHLSYCSDGGHLYDLMPIPFTADAALYVADRIRHVGSDGAVGRSPCRYHERLTAPGSCAAVR